MAKSFAVSKRGWKGFVAAAAVFYFLFAAGHPMISAANARTVQEYAVKAAFLYQFSKFIEWPSGIGLPEDHIAIGILGKDPFGSSIDALENQTIGGKPIRIFRFRSLAEWQPTHFLFISASEKKRLAEIMDHIKGRPIATVGDVPGFTDSGGMINFFIENKKVRFEINYENVTRGGIKVSSRLLSLGRPAS